MPKHARGQNARRGVCGFAARDVRRFGCGAGGGGRWQRGEGEGGGGGAVGSGCYMALALGCGIIAWNHRELNILNLKS